MGSGISVSLRDYDRSIEEAYRRLFPGDPDKSAEMLQWRSEHNPHGPTRFAVAYHGNEIVGMIAIIPTRLRNMPADALGYQAVDTVVHPSCRGQGLFAQLGEAAQEGDALSAAVLWGFPNAQAAPGWFGRLGWTNFGEVPLLVRPLRSSFLLSRVHPKLRSLNFRLVRTRRCNGNVYDDGQQLSTDLGALWQRVAGSFGIAVDRSGEWMRWRLAEKPRAEYRCVGLKTGDELTAFVASKVADKHGARLLYVMEAMSLPEHGKALRRLLGAELSRAADEGADAALAWCPPTAPNYGSYRAAGFLPFPAKLRPVEINFGARALVPSATAAVGREARWYVSFLDSDTN